MKTKSLTIAFFFIGAITMLIMSMHYFQNYLTGVLRGKSVSNELWYHITLRIHIVLGMVAMFSGPLQFSKKIRVRYYKLHKTLGYIYVVSVLTSSIAGFIIAQFAMGGMISALGFTILSLLWFSSTFLAVNYALKKDIDKHQIWMIRSFAVTFSAIPQRLMLLLAFTPFIDFIDVYRLSAWFCWIINLIVAEIIIRKFKK